MKNGKKNSRLAAVVLAAAVGLAGCGDSDLFDVKNPGKILDSDLNSAEGVSALVTGMSSDFSAGYDRMAFVSSRLADELAGSGSYFESGRLRRGLMDSEDSNTPWNHVHGARWVAEGGLQRMAEIEGFTFGGNPLVGRAQLFAGLANRWFGELIFEAFRDGGYDTFYWAAHPMARPGLAYAQGVAPSNIVRPPLEGDDGSPQPRSAAFQRAIPQLEAAITNGDSDTQTAARGVLASVNAWLGNWSTAMSFAAQVPTGFTHYAVYSLNSGREQNEIVSETVNRFEASAFGTLAGSFAAPGDPRAPYVDCTLGGCANTNGADGETDHYMQQKYPDRGANIPLVKGTEMRLLEAENALMGGDLATFNAKVNEVRAFHGLGAVTATSVGSITGGASGGPNFTSMSGWDILDRERWLTNWLEGRRLWDLDRWDHPHLDGGGIVYEATVSRRASCFPISDQECQTNELVGDRCFTS